MNQRSRTSPIGTHIVLFLVFVLLFALAQARMAIGGAWGWMLLFLAMLSLFYLLGGMCARPRHAQPDQRRVEERPRAPEVTGETIDVTGGFR